MTGRGEDWREKHESGARQLGSRDIRTAMRGTGDRSAARCDMARSPPLAQMAARMQCHGEAGIAGDHQHQPAIPANPCHCLPERQAVRILIMAEHDAGEATRQAGDRGPRVS